MKTIILSEIFEFKSCSKVKDVHAIDVAAQL